MNSTARVTDFYLLVIDEPIFWLIVAIFGFLLSFITVAGNFILLATIYRDPQKNLRSPPCLLIANLSVSDFLVGSCVVSLVAFRDVYRSLKQQVPLPDAMHPFMYYVLGTTLFVSSGTMIALSASCFVAINSPIRYKVKITKKRIRIFVAMIWVTSLLMCLLPAIGIPEKIYLLAYCHTHVSLPAVLLTVIYFKGYRALARRTLELNTNGQAVGEISQHALDRERNMGVTVMIILAMFFVSYIPQFITIHLALFCESPAIRNKSVTFYKTDLIASRFVFFNSAVNPFIYAWRMPKYRRALGRCWKLFKKIFCWRNDSGTQGPPSSKKRRGVVPTVTVTPASAADTWKETA